MHTGFILHGRDLVEHANDKEFVEKLAQGNPDEIVIDVFSNGGIQAMRLLPELSKLGAHLTPLAPCYFVKGEQVAKDVTEVTQLFGCNTVMLNVMLNIKETEIIEEFTNQFSWNTPDYLAVTICGQLNFFQKDGAAFKLFEMLDGRKLNVNVCILCNDSKETLDLLYSESFQHFIHEDVNNGSCISPFMIEGNYDSIFGLELPVYFWNWKDFLAIPIQHNPKYNNPDYTEVIALEDRLSVYDAPSISSNIIAKVQKDEIIQITDIIEGKHGIQWGKTVAGNYIILFGNNSKNFQNI